MIRLRKADTLQPPRQADTSENVAQQTARLQEILAAIRDLSQEGFPYQDAAKTKVELQVRECVRQIFGDRSPEFQAFRHYRLRVSTPTEVAESIGAVENLLQTIRQRQAQSQESADPASPPPGVERSGAGDALPLSESSPVPVQSQPISTSKPPNFAVSHLSTPTASTAATTSPPPHGPTVTPPTHYPSTQPTNDVQAIAQTDSFSSPPPSVPLQSAPRSAVSPLSPPLPRTSSSTQRLTRATSSASPPSSPILASTSSVPLSSTAVSGPPSESRAVSLKLVRKVCLRLHAVACQLHLRKDSRPTIEINDDEDLRDLLKALLKMEFDEIMTDGWAPSSTGKMLSSALFLSEEGIAIVAKKTRAGMTLKDLADQITADAAFYASHHPAGTLFCFVYDPEGRIGSPKQFEMDLTQTGNEYAVEVLVAPK
ncbi:MAG: hypothetical protein NNA25_02745 [Nitrospira sp.]|nr:hypothetical protein [Nitrospira sp.]